MTCVWLTAVPQMPGNCSFTVLSQAALLEKLMEKAQYEEINNESESHQMPVAADRLEPRMRTPKLWLRRGGGCCGREADDARALEKWGRTGCGGLHPVASRLPDPPLPPSGQEPAGRTESSPHHSYNGCSCKTPAPLPQNPPRVSTYYVSGLSWHFLWPSHSICASTREMG